MADDRELERIYEEERRAKQKLHDEAISELRAEEAALQEEQAAYIEQLVSMIPG